MEKNTKKKKIHNFYDSLKVGKAGELHVKQYLKNLPNVFSVKDLSNDTNYQKKGIDFRVDADSDNFYLDVKTDTHWNTGNFYLELVANNNKNKRGCLLTSEADFIFYYFTGVNILYIIPLPELQQWISKHKNDLRFKKVKVANKTYSSTGMLVSRDILQKHIPKISKISLN